MNKITYTICSLLLVGMAFGAEEAKPKPIEDTLWEHQGTGRG